MIQSQLLRWIIEIYPLLAWTYHLLTDSLEL